MIEVLLNPFKAGIYVYTELPDGMIVYVGKDSDLISNRRHFDHNRADFKEGKRGQLINKVLQENPGRFVYEQYLFCDPSELNKIETALIDAYRPKFNLQGNDRYAGNKKSKDHIARLKKEPNETD